MAVILDGREYADIALDAVAEKVAALKKRGLEPLTQEMIKNI